MHWSIFLLFLYIVLSQHAFLTVFNDSSQLPAARAGDLGIFRLFSSGSGLLELEILQPLQADLYALVPGAVILYKTNESENGLKLATVLGWSKASRAEKSSGDRKPILHHDVSLHDLPSMRYPEKALQRELGVYLRRWSDACACGYNYEGLPRDFVKPVADIHGVLYASVPLMGLPILMLHRLKVFLAGSGIAGGVATLTYSLASGQHVTVYDLDLDTRQTPRRSSFVWGCVILFSVVAYAAYKLTVLLIGVTSTTVVGIFFFLYAGLHEVSIDCIVWVKESIEDEVSARVGGPAYYGWPVHGRPDEVYTDDLSYAHAQGEGLSTLALLRGRVVQAAWESLRGALPAALRPSPSAAQAPPSGGEQVAEAAEEAAGEGEGGGGGGAVEGEVEARLKCRLTERVMEDPVVAADGFSYERKAITEYLKGSHASPVTGAHLPFIHLVDNNQLRNVIECWRRDPELGPGSGVEEEVKCPITMSPMRDAVLTCDGHSYEREAIIRWLRRHGSSPKSNLHLPSKALITNRNLSRIAAAFRASEPS